MSRDLSVLRPEFLALVEPFLADVRAANIDLVVTCTLRSMADQSVLYAQGRTTPGPIVTNARPGQSAHNYGLAIDVVPIQSGKLVWDADAPIWTEVGNFGLARGLEWYGLPDAPFREMPHFQYPNWRTLT